MNSVRILLALAAIFVVNHQGGSTNKLVGSWEPVPTQGRVYLGQGALTFKSDKTFSMKVTMGKDKMNVSGDYKLAGNNLSMTTRKIEGLPDNMKAMAAEALNKTTKYTLVWRSATEFEQTNERGRKEVYRKKPAKP